MKPLTTEPPLNLPVTKEERIEARRYDLFKQGLLDEEQLHDSCTDAATIAWNFMFSENELELEQQAMQALDDEE